MPLLPMGARAFRRTRVSSTLAVRSPSQACLASAGNVPLEWYDDFDHVGYDLEGRKIMRGARKDELDALIDRFDNPDAGRTIHDYGERASGVTGACPG